MNDGHPINDVKVFICPHDMDASEPDKESAYSLPVKDFEATLTGNQYFGYDEIEINVMFDSSDAASGEQGLYLDGQRFYWIEFKVETQSGTSDFHFLARQGTLHNNAPIRIGNSGGDTYQNDDDADLSYALYGDAVKILHIGASDSLKSGSRPEGRIVHSLYLTQDSGQRQRRFKPGLYQMQMVKGSPQLFHFDQIGKTKLDFVAGRSRDPMMFHTPLGDDMCKDAPDLIEEYCQSFVACAAHDICN